MCESPQYYVLRAQRSSCQGVFEAWLGPKGDAKDSWGYRGWAMRRLGIVVDWDADR